MKRMDHSPSEQQSFSIPAKFPGLLEEMTLHELKEFNPEVVVLPLGSSEPHGPHLPLGTDNFQVDALCRLAVAQANQMGAQQGLPACLWNLVLRHIQSRFLTQSELV